MPVDKDLKTAYSILYDNRDPLEALQKYDIILKEHPDSLTAIVYKAASLEKLYYGYADWHNDQTLENAKEFLREAMSIAHARGDRSKIAFVCFRYFIHYYNNKDYESAKDYMHKCKEYGFEESTLPMWEIQLDKKLKKMTRKALVSSAAPEASETKSDTMSEHDLESNPASKSKLNPKSIEDIKSKSPASALIATSGIEVKDDVSPDSIKQNALPPRGKKIRVDWYQTVDSIVLSLFTDDLPGSKENIQAEVSSENFKCFDVSYKIARTGSDFQYSIILAHEVDPVNIRVGLFTKKIEIELKKKVKQHWKTLESPETNYSKTSSVSNNEDSSTFSYPTSSKKHIDWSKIDYEEEEEDQNAGSADAFFQKIYANADPDTQRAMMKSFVESNGTALNTNWQDVSKGPVNPSPPEGMDLKQW